MKKNLKVIRALVYTSALFFLIGCDFTPRLHKKIIEAQHFIKIQRYEDAIFKYEQILKSNPSNDIKVKIYYQLGELYSINMSDNHKAFEYFRKIKSVTEEPRWLVKSEERIGELNYSLIRNYKESIKSYIMLSSFTPRLEKIDFYEYRLALSYLNSGEASLSKKQFKKIQTNQNHKYFVKSFYYLGLINFQNKNWKRAIAFWNQYIKRESRKDSIVKTKFLMANAYETMESLRKAYDIYYSILGEYPNTEVVQNRLNAIYKRRIARKR